MSFYTGVFYLLRHGRSCDAASIALGARFTVPRSAARVSANAGYRPDIDGLRAVAVLAVVCAHAGIAGFGGGFIGVDVFFVISGYLITRNLAARPPDGLRRLIGFYGRRMRRTLPALYLVVAATLGAGWLWLLPGELDDLAHSAIAALLCVPNILLLNQAGYFDHAAIGKPLLHSWSLGVEEQFYLIAPLLLSVAWWLPAPARRATLIGVFVASLAGCAALQAMAPAAAFYLMPARLWEFLAGVLVAETAVPEVATVWLAEMLAGIALVTLAAAIACFSAATSHPGLPTLLPCLATATLIHIGGRRATFAGRLLGSPPLAAVGLISYSVYLWHWPLLVFSRRLGIELSPSSKVGALALLLGLAALSWRFIEQPFRTPRSVLRRKARYLLPAAALGLAAAGLVIISGRGLPGRFPPEVAAVAGYYDYVNRREFREGSCFITSKSGKARDFDRGVCLRPVADKPNILLIGDSHAAHLWAGFKQVFAADNVMQATASGCKPLLHATGKAYCTDLMRQVFEGFVPHNAIDTIYLSAAWDLEDAGDLLPTVAYLRRYVRHVVVIGRVPGHNAPLPTLLARSLLDHDDQIVQAAQSPYPFAVDRLFRTLIPPTAYVSLTDALCPAGRCEVWGTLGVPLQFDEDHLTSEGSQAVARFIGSRFAAKDLGKTAR